MSDQLPDFSDFVTTLGNEEELMKVYSKWLDGIFSAPLWSPSSQEGYRISWRSFVAARNLDKETFNKPGLYLFGAMRSGLGQDVPRYVGETHADTLWIRLTGRYIGKTKRARNHQCILAESFPQQAIAHERRNASLDNGVLTDPIMMERLRCAHAPEYRGSSVRLMGAIDFAWHGINNIWVTVLPAEHTTVSELRRIEPELIRAARRWNRRNSYPDLVNDKYRLPDW